MRRDDLGDVGRVARPQRSRCDGARCGCARSAQNLGRSGKRSAPECTCSRPCSAHRRNVGNTLPGLKRTSGSNACLMRCCTSRSDVRELVRHQVALLDSDAVLAREHAADVDAELEDLGAERLGAIESRPARSRRRESRDADCRRPRGTHSRRAAESAPTSRRSRRARAAARGAESCRPCSSSPG